MRHSDLMTNIERYWSNVSKGTPDECWPWTGELNNMGYGRFSLWHGDRRTRVLAHRLAIVLAGTTLPDQLKVLHTCDNPPCCNPVHLRVGTQRDNVHDAMAKGRMDFSGLEIGRRMSTRELRQRKAAT